MCTHDDWCAIVLNTPETVPQPIEPFIIAADGGARVASRAMLWVGDGDSSLPPDGVEVLRVPAEKDFTDGELALQTALERGYRKIRIYGVTGGRPDQELNNYSLLIRATNSGAKAEGVGNGVKIAYFKNRATIKTKKDTVISLIALGGAATVHTAEGVKYPLDDLRLCPEAMGRGVSNVATGDTVRFEVSFGGVLAFVYDADANLFAGDR